MRHKLIHMHANAVISRTNGNKISVCPRKLKYLTDKYLSAQIYDEDAHLDVGNKLIHQMLRGGCWG